MVLWVGGRMGHCFPPRDPLDGTGHSESESERATDAEWKRDWSRRIGVLGMASQMCEPLDICSSQRFRAVCT